MGAVRVGLLVFDGVDLLDAGGPYEVFLTANRLARRAGETEPFEVVTVSPDGGAVTAYGGLGLVPHARADAAGPFDVVLAPGMIDIETLLADDRVTAAVRTLAAGADVVGSVCTGAFLLANADVLGGRTVTTHHEDVPALRRLLGDEAVVTTRWVDEGAVATGGALSSGIALALHLTDRFAARELAVATARQLAYPWDPDDASLAGTGVE